MSKIQVTYVLHSWFIENKFDTFYDHFEFLDDEQRSYYSSSLDPGIVVVVGLLVPFRQNQLSMLTVIQNLFIRCVKQLIGKFLAARRIQGSSKSHFFSDRLLRKVPLFIFLKYVVTHYNRLFSKSLLLSCRILMSLAESCHFNFSD